MSDGPLFDGTDEEAGDPAASTRNLTQDELIRVVHAAMPAAVVALAVLAALYTMYFAADLILPVFLALLLSVILRPMVRGIHRLGIPRTISALIVLVGLIGVIVTGLVNLSKPAEEWLQRLPRVQMEIEAKLWPVTQSIKQATEATQNIGKMADTSKSAKPNSEVTIKEATYLDRAFRTTLLTSVQFLIIVALTFFLLSQSTNRTAAFPKIPWLNQSEQIWKMLDTVQAAITRFLQISAAIYLALGLVTALAMYILDMPNPALWGALAAGLAFMPYIGPLIVFCCIAAVSLLTFDPWWQIVTPPLTYGAITIIEGNLVTPAILGRQLELNPIAVFLSMLFWTWVWGMAGAVLAVPILVMIVIAAQHVALILRDKDEALT